MGKFQVANIKFQFDYNFEDYFKNNIEPYKIDDFSSVNHSMIVSLKNELIMPNGLTLGNQNPYVITNPTERIIYFKKNGIINVLIKHDYDYNNILIEINQKNIKNLALTEYIMSSIMFLELAMHLGYLPIHATAISLGGKAILFSAPSGTGKSTHASHWKKVFPEAVFINDDKPIINVENNQLYVYGSPFSGEHCINKNTKSKLKAIVFLKQGVDNKIEKVSIKEVIPELIRNTLNPKLETSWNKIIPLIEKVYEEIPVLRLYATNSVDSVNVIYKYLFSNNTI